MQETRRSHHAALEYQRVLDTDPQHRVVQSPDAQRSQSLSRAAEAHAAEFFVTQLPTGVQCCFRKHPPFHPDVVPI